MKAVRLLSACLIATSLSIPSYALIGGNTSGGGGPDTVSAGALRLLLEGGGLKRAMLNYVQTLRLDQVEDPDVKKQLSRLLTNDALQTDILTADSYKPAAPGQPCVDAFNNEVPASTEIGGIGRPVCFDLQKLVNAYSGLSEEEVMIRLAALAFHEHVHHFQQYDPKRIRQLETEADRLGGYVLVTAKFVQIPVLQWAPGGTDRDEELDEIKKMWDAIRAREKRFLSATEADYAGYPGYKDQTDRGLFRLLPRGKYDEKLSIRGGGAYYTFSTMKHEYGYGSDIELQNGALSVGFAGCDFGYLYDLGDMPLDQVTETLPALKYLTEFMPANHDEPKIRGQQNASRGLTVSGFNYSDRIDKAQIGHTYVVRSINFDFSDVLVAFRPIRQDKDGSLIIAWRKLKTFPVSSCR